MVYRVSGMLLSNARKVTKFIFGDFYISCDLNEKERVFEIKINKSLKVKQSNGIIKDIPVDDYVDIEGFKRYWGGQWRIMYDASEEA